MEQRNSNRNRNIYFTSEKSLFLLQKLAKSEDRTVNYLLNQAVEEFLERNSDKIQPKLTTNTPEEG